jgi:caspase 7
MNHAKRGIALIISFDRLNYDPTRNLNMDFLADVERMSITCNKLSFDVHEYSSLTSGDFKELIDSYSRLDFSNDDCFMCVIIGHGDGNDEIECANEKDFDLKYFYRKFGTIPSLIGKPKIFIISKCRGDNFIGFKNENDFKSRTDEDEETTQNIRQTTTSAVTSKETITSQEVYQGRFADIFKFYSTIDGYRSVGSLPFDCSIFIKILCEKLDEFATTHTLDYIFNEVTKLVNNQMQGYQEKIGESFSIHDLLDKNNTATKNLIFKNKLN